jgi:hypothetical protein
MSRELRCRGSSDVADDTVVLGEVYFASVVGVKASGEVQPGLHIPCQPANHPFAEASPGRTWLQQIESD